MKKKSTAYLFTRSLTVFCVLLLWAVCTAGPVFVFDFAIQLRLWFLSLFLLGILLIAWSGYRFVFLPYQETEKIFMLFSTGYTLTGIYDIRYPFSPQQEAAVEKLKSLLNTQDFLALSERQAQYLALQNQINPHFLYNTLEGIRGEALEAGLDNIAEMTEALAVFFRYTISNVEKLVSLEDELDNVENYYIIQQYRFGDRLKLEVQLAEDDRDMLLKCRLPKLTLQPIVENAIYHGIERKLGHGKVTIKAEATPERMIITVSDTGIGMDILTLSEILAKLNGSNFEHIAQDEKKGGIAIVNVNNRIRLLFGEEYGVNIYSTPKVGTDVEISIPLLPDDSEEVRYEA